MSVQPAPGPDSWLHRLREVRETGDRHATAPLVAHLLAGSAHGRAGVRLDPEILEEVGDTLCVLEDPRCEQPLQTALLDVRLPRALRSVALRVLSCLPSNDPPPLRVSVWLDDPDGLVRAYAASFLGPRDEVRLSTLVHDPAVEVRRAAAESLVGATRTPRLVEALHAALRDEDALVREIACRAALFDEPLAATYDLLHLLDDEDGDVRCGVYDALEDYPCVSVLLALADARSGPDGALAATTLELLIARVGAALGAAPEDGVRRILRWVAPARWLLEEAWEGVGAKLDASARAPGLPPRADVDGGEAGSGAGRHEPERAPVDLRAARAVLCDDDAPATYQRDVLVSRHWTAAGQRGLAVLVEASRSRLWSLRHGIAVALHDLLRGGVSGAADELLRLATDVEPVVRRVAIHALTHARDTRVLGPAHDVLADDRGRAIAGDAALAAVASLGSAQAAEHALLAELSGGHDRDGLRLGAVHLAERLRVGCAVQPLASIVATDVVAGPAVHIAALRALRTLGAPRAVVSPAHLEGLDHLDVQAELGAWDWHGPRYG